MSCGEESVIPPTVVRPSLMSLHLRAQYGDRILGSGTGFLAVDASGSPVLITARHVVTGRDWEGQARNRMGAVPDRLTIRHNVQGVWGLFMEVTESLYGDDGEPLWREHARQREEADIAVLPLTDLRNVRTL